MKTRKALVVGVDDYRDSPLQGCVGDARRIAAILEGKQCEFDVMRMLDEEVTRSNLKEWLHWLLTDADYSLLYFAGHGMRTRVGTYLVTHDAEPFDEGVDLAWLTKAVTGIAHPDQIVVVVLDCCHSGDASSRSLNADAHAIRSEDVPYVSGKGRVVVAACKGNESAYEDMVDGEIRGMFTRHLCSAITGAASDGNGVVTVNAAYDYVSSQLESEGRQTPVFKGDQEGRIELAKNVPKTGLWSPSGSQKMSIDAAIAQADNHLSEIQRVVNRNASFDEWKQSGFADSCRAFLPVLSWFRRRTQLQSELLRDPQFSARHDSCNHFMVRLCNIDSGTMMVDGRLGARIGSGTFGIVWRVESAKWNKPVCFKSFHPHDLGDQEKVGRFRRGYEAMRQLNHPNIVKVLDLSEIPFGFYMDYVDGANLRNYNPASHADPESIIELLVVIAETLKHAHGRGVLHRDVKPENILIDMVRDPVEPFLTDFDLAWFSTATQVTNVAGFGSHYYAAPEQMDKPLANVSHQPTVDIYSFGQLCFFVSCGRDPQAFNHDGNIRAMENELGKRWRDSDASKQLLTLFDRCTRFKPEERITDFREVSDILASIRGHLQRVDEAYDAGKFVSQVEFNLSGRLPPEAKRQIVSTFRSRSGKTEMTFSIAKNGSSHYAVEVVFRPNNMVKEGRSSAEVRALVNQKIDAMLNAYARDHSTERRGAKAGAYEITVHIDKLEKSMPGVLRCREIVTRTLDILEGA